MAPHSLRGFVNFPNKSSSTSVTQENAAALLFGEAPERFYEL